jgi:hypothetical protein
MKIYLYNDYVLHMCFGVIFCQMKAMKPELNKGKYALKRERIERKWLE